MAEMITNDGHAAPGGWPFRPLLLAAMGGSVGLAVQQLLDQPGPPSAERLSVAIAIGTAAIGFGFVAERVRLWWAMIFALVIGLTAGLIMYWHGVPGGSGEFFSWRLLSLFLAIAIAAPLFQTARDEAAWRFPYANLHGHAWTNVVVWIAAWAFVGVTFMMSWLLATLFNLIKIDLLEKLLGKPWFMAVLIGASFGAAVGLLRERDHIVRLLQNVVTAVLGVLAPVLGAGLVLFVLALPFTGLDALWGATRNTTPILLSCIAGGLILANAVIGNGDREDRRHPVLAGGAIALASIMLPLGGIAAIATGLRTNQYGYTPDRLWALVFVVLACAYAVAYLGALVRGRRDWAVFARSANVFLGFVVAGVALFLATPLISFNAISTADQVGRLTSGAISPDKFDWAALAFDFGAPGKAALKQLARSNDAAIAAKAKSAMTKASRYELVPPVAPIDTLPPGAKRLRVLPKAIPVPADLRLLLQQWDACGELPEDKCIVVFSPGNAEAIAFRSRCFDQLVVEPAPSATPAISSPSCPIARFVLNSNTWRTAVPRDARLTVAERAQLAKGLANGGVEVRPVQRRQLFIGGVPVGNPFE